MSHRLLLQDEGSLGRAVGHSGCRRAIWDTLHKFLQLDASSGFRRLHSQGPEVVGIAVVRPTSCHRESITVSGRPRGRRVFGMYPVASELEAS